MDGDRQSARNRDEVFRANAECDPSTPTTRIIPSFSALVNVAGGQSSAGESGEGNSGGGGGGGGGREVGPAEQEQDQDNIILLAKNDERKKALLQSFIEEICEWITRLVGVEISAETFLHVLGSGVVLCDIAKEIDKRAQDYARQGKLTEPLPSFELKCNTKAGPWFSRDNVGIFLEWCKARGMRRVFLFSTEDLVSNGREEQVVNCLRELARIGWKFGIEPPKHIHAEHEDDQEYQEDIEDQASSGLPPSESPPSPSLYSPPSSPQKPGKRKRVEESTDVQIAKEDEKADLHEQVMRSAYGNNCQDFVTRIKEGFYDVNGKRTKIFLIGCQNLKLLVRVGGGWAYFEEYLEHHVPLEVRGFRRSGSRANLQEDAEFVHCRSKYTS